MVRRIFHPSAKFLLVKSGPYPDDLRGKKYESGKAQLRWIIAAQPQSCMRIFHIQFRKGLQVVKRRE